MKTSTLILLAAAGLAVWFIMSRKAASPSVVYQPAPATRSPASGGELSLDNAISAGSNLLGNVIGGLFG